MHGGGDVGMELAAELVGAVGRERPLLGGFG
jgi:hypothetical protein